MCPSVTRWSAARLAVTVGTAATVPSSLTQGRGAIRPKPTRATWGGLMMPNAASTPWSPRLVTVMVGSASYEPRSDAARVLATRSESSRISWGMSLAATSCSAGATNPPCRSEIATPMWTVGAGWKAPSMKKPLS